MNKVIRPDQIKDIKFALLACTDRQELLAAASLLDSLQDAPRVDAMRAAAEQMLGSLLQVQKLTSSRQTAMTEEIHDITSTAIAAGKEALK